MNKLEFQDINLQDVGNTIQISGLIMSGQGANYLCYFPDERHTDLQDVILVMNMEEWDKFIRQTDILEAEMFSTKNGKLVKIVVRKSTRQIEQRVMWKVYKRDGYRCRYCGRDEVPLTVDHVVLWEKGGPSIEENLVSACKECNKTRGNMEYVEWLASPYYKKVSASLDIQFKQMNEALVSRIPDIPVRIHITSR